MGQSSSSANNLSLHRWELVSEVPGRYLVVRDNSGRQGQEYLVHLQPTMRAEEEFAIYRKRKKTPQPIVHIYGAEYTEPMSICSQPTGMRVITEHLQLRLHQIKISRVGQAIYLARQLLRGYQYLFKAVGCMSIRADMVGLTSEGEVRVWIHRNFSTNRPQLPKRSLPGIKRNRRGISDEEKWMIEEIVQLLRQQCDKTVFLRAFGNRLEAINSFDEAQNILEQIQYQRNEPSQTRIDFTHR